MLAWFIALAGDLPHAGGHTDHADVQWTKGGGVYTHHELSCPGSERCRKAVDTHRVGGARALFAGPDEHLVQALYIRRPGP